jgi:hypothetical protein
MVKKPATAQATKSQPAEPKSRVMPAETMKIPEPIMDPETIITESVRPRERLKSVNLKKKKVESQSKSSFYKEKKSLFYSSFSGFFKRPFTVRTS